MKKAPFRENGKFVRTGKIQTEKTATGVITTAEERNAKTRHTRWAQIGYTSILEDNDGKKYFDGLYGQPLADVMDKAA